MLVEPRWRFRCCYLRRVFEYRSCVGQKMFQRQASCKAMKVLEQFREYIGSGGRSASSELEGVPSGDAEFAIVNVGLVQSSCFL